MPVVKYFPYFGPNRRSDRPVVEITLNTAADDGQNPPSSVSGLKSILQSGGVLTAGDRFPKQVLPTGTLDRYASLLVQTALLFQRKAGHRVSFFSVSSAPHQDHCTALLEHEHCDVGMTAVKLADEIISGKRKSLNEPFRLFYEFARERLLPRETEAIIKAAHRRDIPCIQLERYPFSRDKHRPICIRRNGLLMLGHGAHHHVLDGTFCLDKSGDRLNALLRNQSQRSVLLKELGFSPVATSDSGKADENILYVYVINGQVTAVVGLFSEGIRAVENLPESLLDMCVAVNREVEGFPIVVTLTAADFAKPLAKPGVRVVDFALAPDLERLTDPQLGPGSQLQERTVDALLAWLFPDRSSARVPIIAVTGTNGKTTTARMISQVMKATGRKPGMVITDGIFLNEKQISSTDASSLLGHSKVLTSKEVDVAVLESHHRGIFLRGFAFHWCDVAVCLNVADDHLDKENIRSVEEMAIVKRALLERARYAAILNADNEHCLHMLAHMVAEKICLVSMQSGTDELRSQTSKEQLCFCVLEFVDGHEWVVIYDQVPLPVIPVASMPATFGGLARFNISNAMHAIAACYLAGTCLKDIKAGMESFSMSFDNTPGRLNFYEGHPFRVLLDFAHNTDGMRQLSEFVERIEVSGRKILMLQARGDIEDKYAKGIAAVAARHFDHFVCRPHPLYPAVDKHKVPGLLKASLLNVGVCEHQITTSTDPVLALDTMLNMGVEGDLLVFTPGSGQPRIDTWNRIISFKSGSSDRD
jgi:UDP-N-acetylmuramyl tripeptide synthase